MIKVVIIDDESIIRIGLKAIFNWEQNGFLIVGEATNGREGLELILRETPDLVITDIKMPLMNGIELIRETYNYNKHIKFIIMSGYGEYNLIRSAMKLGAIDYLMKLELGPENLLESLKLFKEKHFIAKDSAQDSYTGSEKMALLSRELVNFLLFEQPDAPRLKNYVKKIGFELHEESYAVAHLFTGREYVGVEEPQKIRDFYLRDIPLEILGETLQCASFEKELGSQLLILSTSSAITGAELRGTMEEAYARIQKKLNAFLNCNISLAVSDIHHSFTEIGLAVQECQKAYREITYHEEPRINFQPSDVERSGGLTALREDMHKVLASGNRLAIYTLFEKIREQIATPDITCEAALEICKQLTYYYLVLSQDESSMLKRLSDSSDIVKSINSLATVTQVTQWIDKFRNSVLSETESSYSDNMSQNVIRAQKYIASRVCDRITLNDVASYLHLSPNYLSSLFKRYTGESFTEYFNICKIKKAKELISLGRYKIYEISGMLGFDNSYYFSKVFKKVVGCAPSEYEENLLKSS